MPGLMKQYYEEQMEQVKKLYRQRVEKCTDWLMILGRNLSHT
jgi:hypothetical protein